MADHLINEQTAELRGAFAFLTRTVAVNYAFSLEKVLIKNVIDNNYISTFIPLQDNLQPGPAPHHVQPGGEDEGHGDRQDDPSL